MVHLHEYIALSIVVCQCLSTSNSDNTPFSFRSVLDMVSATAMRSALATTAMLPDWAAMSWVRVKVMQMIKSFPSQSLGEAATTITVSSLKDWSPEGAAYLKMRLTEWVQNDGMLGGRVGYHPSDQGFAKLHADLKNVLKDSLTQQTNHMKRTVSLPLDRVQKLILLQHAANDHGLLFNFYTDVETRGHLFTDYAVVVDGMSFDFDSPIRTAPDVVEWMTDTRRTIIRTDEDLRAPGQELSIEFFMNRGEDAGMLLAWKDLVGISAGLSEASIDSVMSLFDDLPPDTGILRLERDPTSGEFSFLLGDDEQLHTLLEHLEARSGQDAPDATEGTDPEDTHQDGPEETDPVEDTDPQQTGSHVNFNEMD